MDTLLQRARQARRQLGCAGCLLPIYASVYYLAYWLRFDGQLDVFHRNLFQATIVPVVLVKCLAFGWFRVYHGWNRPVTFHDLLALVQASTVSSVALALCDYLLVPLASVPRSSTATRRSSPARFTARTLISITRAPPRALRSDPKGVQTVCKTPCLQHERDVPNCQALRRQVAGALANSCGSSRTPERYGTLTER